MSRNNRKIIEKCCKDLNLEIEDLSYERSSEYIYGDGFNVGYWKLFLKNGKYYETTMGEEADYAVDSLCQELKEDYSDNLKTKRTYNPSDFEKCYNNLHSREFGDIEHP